MKKLLSIAICLVFIGNAFGQEKFTVPEQTSEQKYEEVMSEFWWILSAGINFAKTQDVSAYEYGEYIGNIFVPSWNQENGFDGAKQTSWAGKYEQLTNEDVAIEERSVDDWLDRRSSTLGKGVGMGVTPLFDTYGVFRTSGSHDKSTYVALGYISDELTMDEAGTSDSRDDNGFSYGFGVNNSTSNFEYMMSVDQENYEVSAIGMSFISKF